MDTLNKIFVTCLSSQNDGQFVSLKPHFLINVCEMSDELEVPTQIISS